MHIWHTAAIAIILLLSPFSTAQAYQACGIDLDGDNKILSQGETAACEIFGNNTLCPLDATACQQQQQCPIDPALPCVSGSCNKTGSCTALTFSDSQLYALSSDGDPHFFVTHMDYIQSIELVEQYSVEPCTKPVSYTYFGVVIWADLGCKGLFKVTGTSSGYKCSLTGEIKLTLEECQTACDITMACELSTPSCPLNGGGPCINTGGGQYHCSATACAVVNPEFSEIDDSIYLDDGQRDASGLCTDTIMLFSGRNQECRTAGKSTAFQSCCKDFDMIVEDSTGSISEMSVYNTAISGTYQVASAAYTTYSATGSSAAAASSAGETALTAFDPTTLAISIAIAVAIDYFVNNCSQDDMETGMAKASGMCYPTGTYCKESWPFIGCVQEADTYCCFNSKLARIIHEQGRPQLKSFNSSPANDCRGFYPEEFQYLDFSRIDLSEYYGDLKTATEATMKTNVSEKINNFYDSMQ